MNKQIGYRSYTTNNRLATWMNRCCEVCGRFLSKSNPHKICSRCAKKYKVIYIREYRKIHPEYRELQTLRMKVYHNPNRFSVGDIV